MKILWISPRGLGWALADHLQKNGNQVEYFCPDPHNEVGTHVLRRISLAQLWPAMAQADQIVVDDNFAPIRGRRSWSASRWVQDIWSRVTKLEKRAAYVGPTPSTELLEYDPRYVRKILGRVGLEPAAAEEPLTMVHIDGEDACMAEDHSSGRLVLIPSTFPPRLVKLLDYLRELGYNGPVTLGLSPAGQVGTILARLTYPAAFGLAHLQIKGGASVEVRLITSADKLKQGERLWLSNVFVKDGRVQAPRQNLGVGTTTLPPSVS